MHRWFTRSRRAVLTPVSVVGFALVVLAGSSSAAQDPQTTQLNPIVTSAVRGDTSPALRTLKPSRASLAPAKAKELPGHGVPHELQGGGAKQRSAAVQKGVVTNAMPNFDQNFEGVGNVNGVLRATETARECTSGG